MSDSLSRDAATAASSSTVKVATTAALTVVPTILLQLWTSKGVYGRSRTRSFLFSIFLASASFLWLGLVCAIVPEPYLDEIFHIPQAQTYCAGRFTEWDDKITTPPGLYLSTIFIPEALKRTGIIQSYACDATTLRAANAIALIILSHLTLLCRQQIEANHSSVSRQQRVSDFAIHTALNIGLFPLLFFFSGLYYTDIASTVAVIAAFLNHLYRVQKTGDKPRAPSVLSDLVTLLLGILTLFMRQTNVFWVVVFMGGLEAVHAAKKQPSKVDAGDVASKTTLWGRCKLYLEKYASGDVHDPPLRSAWPDDMLLCAVSLVIAALCNPFRVLRQIWPYVAVLASFAAFVLWNGGVVLGDKSNHVATIHLAQMLYIWPFFAFFSLPLLLPFAANAVLAVLQAAGVVTRKSQLSQPASKNAKNGSASQSNEKSAKRDPGTKNASSMQLNLVCVIFESKVILWLAYISITLLLSFGIVKYNTIIHPFTLADNRHYMFYIFRYSIRRGALIRYFLILPYTVSRWLVWGTMAGSWNWLLGGEQTADEAAPFSNHPFRDTALSMSSAATAVRAGGKKQTSTSNAASVSASEQSIPTSTALIFLLATTLSLVTAPLVEPRYFIIPWVMWRLMVPAWRPSSQFQLPAMLQGVVDWCERHDARLWLETVWFLAINAATGYIFLCKPYLWKAEDGTVLEDGRLQRFMW